MKKYARVASGDFSVFSLIKDKNDNVSSSSSAPKKTTN